MLAQRMVANWVGGHDYLFKRIFLYLGRDSEESMMAIFKVFFISVHQYMNEYYRKHRFIHFWLTHLAANLLPWSDHYQR